MQEYINTDSDNQNIKTENLETSGKESLDANFKIIVLQGGIVAAVLIFCLIVKLLFGDFFVQIKDIYNGSFKVNTDIEQVIGDSSGMGGPLEKSVESTAVVDPALTLPVRGSVTGEFGYRADPFTGEIAAHGGIDIAAPMDTPIYAAASGVVETSDYSKGDYGNYIVIKHGGFSTLYAHCNNLLVKQGQTVPMGQAIATCGSTGRSTGPHLHFEVRIGDKKIDPAPLLKIENK